MAGRFRSFYSHLTLQRAQGRLAAARRASPFAAIHLDHEKQPDDDLGHRPDEVPVLRRPPEAPQPRTGDEITPPSPTHVPLPGRDVPARSRHA